MMSPPFCHYEKMEGESCPLCADQRDHGSTRDRDRFMIRTDLDPGGLLNATTDKHGRPGDLSQLLPAGAKIVSVVSLPVGDYTDSHPEAFRLMIVYRTKRGRP